MKKLGRPKGTKRGINTVRSSVCMTAEELHLFKDFGGSRWLQKKINEEKKRRVMGIEYSYEDLLLMLSKINANLLKNI